MRFLHFMWKSFRCCSLFTITKVAIQFIARANSANWKGNQQSVGTQVVKNISWFMQVTNTEQMNYRAIFMIFIEILPAIFHRINSLFVIWNRHHRIDFSGIFSVLWIILTTMYFQCFFCIQFLQRSHKLTSTSLLNSLSNSLYFTNRFFCGEQNRNFYELVGHLIKVAKNFSF